MQLIQAKLKDIILGNNISRAGVAHTESEIRAHSDKIIVNKFWDPPDVVRHGHKKDRYDLVAGYLRIHAAILMVAESRLPEWAGDKNGVYVLLHNKTEYEKHTLNAAENLVKKNLSTYQTAVTLYNIQEEHGTDNRTLSVSYGIDVKTIANYIRAARELITPIQLAWLNFEHSENPIPLVKLLAWAALTPEDQLREFETSKWGRIYKMVDNQKKPKTIRRRVEIERRLQNAFGIERETLEWVLCLTEENSDRHNRNDSRNSGPTASNGSRPRTGRTPSNGHDSSLWAGQAGSISSNADDAPGAPGSRGAVDSSSATDDDD